MSDLTVVDDPRTPRPDDYPDIASALMARLGDSHPGLRTREQTWTWDEVVHESAARGSLAQELRTPGRPFHIGVLLENVPDFAFWLGAAALVGATIVGINPTRGDAELAEEVRFTDCQLIVTDTAGYQRLRTLELNVPEDRFLLVDDPAYQSKVAEIRATVQPAVAEGVGPESLMLLLFTSGTTGRSKAVKCSQRRLAWLGHFNTRKYFHSRDDVSYCCMPMFHGNALMALWAPALVNGATVALIRKFSASQFLDDVRFYGATFFTYVGKALGYLMATPEKPDDIDNTLQRGFGTEASPDDKVQFVRRFGAQLYEGYGSSEGAGSVKLDPDAPGAALGRPAHAGIKIVNPDTLEECPPAILSEHGIVQNPDEAIGEMINTEGAIAFEGYYKNDAADAERLRNGWYWTGDLGYIDEAGFIYFAGRKGDWIRIDGENTSALMIEHVIRRYPKTIACGVFAVPDPRSGDQVMAAIEVSSLDDFDPVDFAAFLSTQADLGTKATPRFVRVSEHLPVTGSNKVLKRDLQKDKWHTDEPVYRWVGRKEVEYHLMTQEEKQALDDEFRTYGRERFL